MGLLREVSANSRPLLWAGAIGMSILLFGLVLGQVEWRVLLELLDGIAWPLLWLGLAVSVTEGWFTARRIQIMTPGRPATADSLRVTAWYVMMLLVLPARLGELAVLLLFKRYLNQPAGPALANLVVQRLLDVAVLSAVFLVCAAALSTLPSDPLLVSLAAGLLAGLGAGIIWLDHGLAGFSRLLRRTGRVQANRRRRTLLRMGLQARRWHRRHLTARIALHAIGLTLCKWLCNLGGFALVLGALGVLPSVAERLLTGAAYNFLAIVPVQSVGGIGIGEVGLTGILLLLGVPLAAAASVSVLMRVVLILAPVLFWATALATARALARNSHPRRGTSPIDVAAAPPTADRVIDGLYGTIRSHYGAFNAKANGYRLESYFLREQEMVLEALGKNPALTLDVACGSGLMVEPLSNRSPVVGLDFNRDACAAARSNGIAVVRGDAFCLPLRDDSVDRLVTCQFFNQQTRERVERFVTEAGRVLRPGGRAIFVWRNGRAWIHRCAHAVFRVVDWVNGHPTFPCVDHSAGEISGYARSAGLTVESEEVTFPLLRWRSRRLGGIPAALIGASYFVVLSRPPV